MTVPARIEIQVYPNLTGERRNLAAHFLKRGQLGIHAQRQVGMGRDFERLREYIPGDSYDEIHWKATAKRRYPITKVFQIERTQDIYVVIDASRLSARKTTPLPRHRSVTRRKGGGSDPTILERFVTAALIMALIAERQGDLFGILTFNDKIRNFVRAKGGKAHYNACRDALYTLQSEDVTPDFDELFTFIGTRLRRRALLLFLTSLDDEVLAESFVRKIDVICRRHLVLVNMLRPPGARPLFSDPEVGSVDDLYRHLSGHFLWAALRELEKVLQRRGVRLSLLDDERICPELVSLYLGVKQRQLL